VAAEDGRRRKITRGWVEEKYRPIKKQMEEDVIAAGWFEPKVVYGYFPVLGDGNDVVVYDPSQ